MKSRNEIMRNNRKRRKIENKCEICSAPRYKDSSDCLKCLKKRQEHNQKSYAKQKIMIRPNTKELGYNDCNFKAP